jgi:hypothetical protein
VEGESGGTSGAEVLDHSTGELDHMGLSINKAAMFGEPRTRLLVTDQHAYGLQDLKRRLVNVFHLSRGEKPCKSCHHSVLDLEYARRHNGWAPGNG